MSGLAEVAEWQTRRSQKPLGKHPCGFESHLRHQRERCSNNQAKPRNDARGFAACPKPRWLPGRAHPDDVAFVQGLEVVEELRQLRAVAPPLARFGVPDVDDLDL